MFTLSPFGARASVGLVAFYVNVFPIPQPFLCHQKLQKNMIPYVTIPSLFPLTSPHFSGKLCSLASPLVPPRNNSPRLARPASSALFRENALAGTSLLCPACAADGTGTSSQCGSAGVSCSADQVGKQAGRASPPHSLDDGNGDGAAAWAHVLQNTTCFCSARVADSAAGLLQNGCSCYSCCIGSGFFFLHRTLSEKPHRYAHIYINTYHALR